MQIGVVINEVEDVIICCGVDAVVLARFCSSPCNAADVMVALEKMGVVNNEGVLNLLDNPEIMSINDFCVLLRFGSAETVFTFAFRI